LLPHVLERALRASALASSAVKRYAIPMRARPNTPATVRARCARVTPNSVERE